MRIKSERYQFLDFVRGIAVVLMVFFHFFYDLTHFGYTQINFSDDAFWFYLPRLIVFLFLICLGMSLTLVHHEHIRWRPYWTRLARLVGLALAISLITWLLFPDRWVYFGTLHCMAVCSLIALPFVRFPRSALVIAVAILVIRFGMGWQWDWFPMMKDAKSVDFIPAYPWMNVALLGVFLGSVGLYRFPLPSSRPTHGISFLGRHSLLIYVLHQPILFGSIALIHFLTH